MTEAPTPPEIVAAAEAATLPDTQPAPPPTAPTAETRVDPADIDPATTRPHALVDADGNPLPSPDATTRQPEAEQSAETVMKVTQSSEIKTIGINLLTRQKNAALAEVGNPPDPDKLRGASEATLSMLTLDLIGKGTIPLSLHDNPAKPVSITRNGKTYVIGKLTGVSNGKFTTTEMRGQNEVPGPDFTGQEIYDAQLIADKDTILDSISDPHQKKVVELYIQSRQATLTDPPTSLVDQLPDEGSEESKALNKTIKEAARTAAIFTVDDITAFGKASDLSEAEQRQLEVTLQGHNLLSYEGFLAAMNKTDHGPRGIDTKLAAIKANIDLLKKNPDKAAELAAAEIQLAMLNRCKELYESKEGGLKTMFDSIQDGTMDQTVAQAVIEGFRSGTLVESIQKIPGLERKDGESKADWEKRLKDAGKGLGILALIMLVLGTIAATQGIQKATAGGH